jgi:hypothetical protein
VDTYTIIAIVLAGFQAGVAILQFMWELLALRRDVQDNEDEQQAEVPKGWLLQCPPPRPRDELLALSEGRI